MNQEMRKIDYLLLLPTFIPIAVLFVIPLIYSASLVFSTPMYDDNGKEIYISGQYEYHYNLEENKYLEVDSTTHEQTGVKLKPYKIKSQPDTYKKKQVWGLQNFKTFFSEKRYYVTIKNTFMVVIPATLIQFLLAFSMAYFLRKKIKGKFLYSTLIIFPLTLGSLIIAAGMTNFFRTGGWFNMILMNLGIIKEPITILYTYWGTIIASVIGGTAFLFSGFLAVCEGIDTNLELAAQTLGANKIKTFLKIFLPIVMPSLLSIFALNMVLSLGIYPSAVLVGDPIGSTRVFAVAAFEEFQQSFNYNMAATISFVLTLSQLLVLMIIGAIRKRMYIGYGGSFK